MTPAGQEDAPALSPDLERLLGMMRAAGRPPFEALSLDAARQAYAAGRAVLQPPPEEVAAVRNLDIPGPGGRLPLRFYRGAGTSEGDLLPGLLYLHGGGWVLGSLDSHDGICRRMANLAGCAVVAVDYRLAPEHPFPAALDDAAAALSWMAEAPGLGIDPARTAVAGDSAGGNLAAVLALMGRDRVVPPSVFQLLFYPVVDVTAEAASYARTAVGMPLTAATMRWFTGHYVPDAAQRSDWRASPLRADRLQGVPPALVVTAGHDPLADEGRAYAERLVASSVRVAALHLADQAHGFLTMGKVIGATDAVLHYAGAQLRDAWRLGGRTGAPYPPVTGPGTRP